MPGRGVGSALARPLPMPLRPTLVLVLCLAGCTTRPADPPPSAPDPVEVTEPVDTGSGSDPAQESIDRAESGMADATPDERVRLGRWQALNSACRGGSGDDPATMQACDARDAAFDSLEALSWCYGEPDQAGFEMEWHRCTAP